MTGPSGGRLHGLGGLPASRPGPHRAHRSTSFNPYNGGGCGGESSPRRHGRSAPRGRVTVVPGPRTSGSIPGADRFSRSRFHSRTGGCRGSSEQPLPSPQPNGPGSPSCWSRARTRVLRSLDQRTIVSRSRDGRGRAVRPDRLRRSGVRAIGRKSAGRACGPIKDRSRSSSSKSIRDVYYTQRAANTPRRPFRSR